MLTKITFNLANTAIRHETLQGRAYLVAPLAMITEGVHNGSGGALLYKEAELKRAVPAWNMKPIVVYHPEIDGKGISACDPLVLEKQQVGMVMNTRWKDGKLRAEAWIEEARANVVDDRVIKALENNQMMEVSTGLFTDNVGAPGKWNEKDYVAEAVNHQPDHLALLPDQIGACSIADGAGLLQLNEAASAQNVDVTRLLARQMDVIRRMVGNAMSNSNTHQAIQQELRGRKKNGGGYCYVVDVYPDFFVYEDEAPNGGGIKLFKLGYTAKKNEVTLAEDSPEEVVRVTEYRTAEAGKFVGNEAHIIKESSMDRKTVIDGLIANEANGWEEGDRATLEKMDDATLNKWAMPKKGKKKPPVAEDEETVVENKAQPVANAQPQTAEQFIAAAPPEIRSVLTNSLAVHNAEKARLIETITANKQNKFSKEWLAQKDLQELQGLAALCSTPTEPTANSGVIPMFYGGQATVPGVAPVTNAATETALQMPTMNFERQAKK